jgi:hypothetical protein
MSKDAKPRVDLASIEAPESVSDTPDQKTKQESDSLEEHARAKRELEIQSIKQTLTQRKNYARATFCLVCLWLTAVLVIAFFQGFGAGGAIRFKLETGVMIALIATTTANIIAVLVIVMKYLFPNRVPPQK